MKRDEFVLSLCGAIVLFLGLNDLFCCGLEWL
jgi:hypothetical protein